MNDSINPIQVRLELIGKYPGNSLDSPHGKFKTYPLLPRINDFIYYEEEWYQVIGVYLYPCEATSSHLGITLKIKYIERNDGQMSSQAAPGWVGSVGSEEM